MAAASFNARARSELLALVAKVPAGRVTTVEVLGEKLGTPAPLVGTLLAQLTADERDIIPWHRVVAKGGAIGRGLHRDQQFARLVQEGVIMSPAGVVQDLARVMLINFDEPLAGPAVPNENRGLRKPGGRSRGMKERP